MEKLQDCFPDERMSILVLVNELILARAALGIPLTREKAIEKVMELLGKNSITIN